MADGLKIVVYGDDTPYKNTLKNLNKLTKTETTKMSSEYEKSGKKQSNAMEKSYNKIEKESEQKTKKVKADFDDEEDKAKKSAKSIEKSYSSAFSKVGGIAKKGLGAAVTGIAAFSGALVVGGGYAVKMASDLEEVQNVVDVTFGDSASKINAWSKEAKTAFGMSELQAKRFSGTMGAMVKSMGLSDDAVFEMSTNLTGLAGDFASFYNLEHEEAFEKIRAGISGETEPLRQLGINMSVANLEAFALSEGITKSYSEMTQAEQATLRYNYLLQAGADAQGDFARTSDSFANQLRVAKLSVDEIATSLGTVLMPAANAALGELSKYIQQLQTAFNENGVEGLVSELGNILTNVVTEISENMPQIFDNLLKGTEFIPSIIEFASNLVSILGRSIAEELPKLILKLPEIIFKTKIALTKSFVEIGVSLVQGLWEGFVKVQKDTSFIDEIQEKTNNVIESMREQRQAYEDLVESSNEKAAADMVEIAQAKDLYNALGTLIDANGQINEQNEERASFILGELNSALNTEYTMADLVSGKYKEMGEAIDSLIQKKQAQILLEAHEEEYRQAILNRTEALKAQEETYQKLQAVQEVVNQKLAEGASLSAIEEADLLPGLEDAYLAAQNNVLKYSETVSQYEEAMAASADGNTEKIIAILDKGNIAYKTATQIAEEQSKLTKEEVAQNYIDAVNKVQVAYDNLNKENNSTNQKALADAIKYAAELRKAYENSGGAITDGLITGLDGKSVNVSAKAEEIGIAGADAIETTYPNYDEAGKYAGDGAVAGLNSKQQAVYIAGYALGKKGVEGYNAGQDAHSPAKEYEKASENSISGLVKGIKDNKNKLTKIMSSLAGEGKSELEKVFDEMNEELLESEKEYLSEKERIEKESYETEYQERLKNAKNAEEIEKIKQDRINEEAKEQQDAYLENLKKTSENERKIYEALLKDIDNIAKEKYDLYSNSIDKISDKQKDIAKTLYGEDDTYTKYSITAGGKTESYIKLADQSKDINQLNTYNNLLDKLNERNPDLPDEVVGYLSQMGVEEGISYVQAMLNASEEEFDKYIADIEEKQRLAEEISQKLTSDEVAELKKSFEDEFGEVPEDFFNLGEDSAAKFGEGFMNQLNGLMKEIEMKVSQSMSFLSPSLSFGLAAPGAGSVTSYSNTYNFNAAKSTITEQLNATNYAQTVERMRGGK